MALGMELRGNDVLLRPLAEDDAPRLAEFVADPDVSRWWPGLTADGVRAKARGEEAGVTSLAILVDGGVAGLIQFWEEEEPEYRHAGIDLFLGTPYHGRGLGTDAVRTLSRHLIHNLGHHRLTIDPAASNARAIRCYEKVGFRRVGVLRQHEHGPDGWRDGLLMDLLAPELT